MRQAGERGGKERACSDYDLPGLSFKNVSAINLS